jgi:hypothetical protein
MKSVPVHLKLIFTSVNFVSCCLIEIRTDEFKLLLLYKPDLYLFLLLVNAQLGRTMAQAVSRRPPTAEVGPCGICGGQSGTGTGFLRYFCFPLPISFHRCSIKMEKQKKPHYFHHLHDRVAQ